MRCNAGLLAGFLAAAGCAEPSTESLWAHSVAAPARFEVNARAKSGVDLPASREAFTHYMLTAGAQYYVTGEGDARVMSASPPARGSPCTATAKMAVFSIPTEGAFAPRYVAYLDVDELVHCVEKQLSYLGL